MKELEQKIGHIFKDKDLLTTALTHRSFVNENSGIHNERLEYLGDAVLQFVSTNFLFEKYPDLNEGKLSLYRSALVNKSSLNDVANTLNILEFVRLSKGRTPLLGGGAETIGSDAVEAVIGAMYLDAGLPITSKFIHKFILSKIDDVLQKASWMDAKTKLQEQLQSEHHTTPIYRTIESSGKEHQRNFVVAVYYNDIEIGRGEGLSKQKAQQKAAEDALNNGKW